MKEIAFKTLCKFVQKGETRFVENTQTHHAGKALSCRDDRIEVEIYGKHETWAHTDCEEFGKPDFDYHR
jgi:hypothetical protein